jgi:hypothetical protein
VRVSKDDPPGTAPFEWALLPGHFQNTKKMIHRLMVGLLKAAQKLEASSNTALRLEQRKGEDARKRRECYRRLIRICWDLETTFARFKNGGTNGI